MTPLNPIQTHALARCIADRPGETLSIAGLGNPGEPGPVRVDFDADELVILETGTVVSATVMA